jgi:hypothetical protein
MDKETTKEMMDERDNGRRRQWKKETMDEGDDG